MTFRLFIAAFVTAAALGFAGTAAANEKFKAEVAGYTLTEAGLAKFTRATRNLHAMPDACSFEGEDSGDASIDAMVARMDRHAGAKAAVQSAGMTTREYAVFVYAMVEAGMAAYTQQQSGKLPPGAKQANADFYKKHEAQMTALVDEAPCDVDD